MVISLETQNVKIKRSVYLHSRRNYNLKFKITQFKMPAIEIGLNSIPFIIGFLLFLMIFAKGHNFFIPKQKTVIDLNSIILPENSADVLSKNLIVDYEQSYSDKAFSRVKVFNGETLSSLSIKYGVTRDTILNFNGISDLKKFREVDDLIIPTVNGYRHRVTPKDTLDSLSVNYGVPVKDIFWANGLKSQSIVGLDWVFIPYVNPTEYGWKSNISKYFVYPVNGYITKRYGFFTNNITGLTSLYEGIDITPLSDDRVYASKDGYISRIGYSANYGNYIYIDHSGGLRTLYAHLEKIEVSTHDTIKQGDIIGNVGRSGFTSSKKLFFSILDKDATKNPEEYLK